MEISPKSTEEIVREAIIANYGDADFLHDERLIRHLVDTVEDPTMKTLASKGDASPAVEWVRSALWSTDYVAASASQATRDLFCALGRQSELGPLAE